jgi:hypothetical protein
MGLSISADNTILEKLYEDSVNIKILESELDTLEEDLDDLSSQRSRIKNNNERGAAKSYSEYLVKARFEDKKVERKIDDKKEDIATTKKNIEHNLFEYTIAVKEEEKAYSIKLGEYENLYSLFKITEKKFKQGSISEMEYNDEYIKIKEFENEVKKAERTLEYEALNYKFFMGLDYDSEVELIDINIEILEPKELNEIYEMKILKDENLNNLQNDLNINVDEEKYVKAYYGKNEAKHISIINTIEKLKLQIDERKRSLYIESYNDFMEYKNMYEEYLLLKEKSNILEEKYRLKKLQYEKGLVSVFELIEEAENYINEQISFESKKNNLYLKMNKIENNI